MSVFRIILKINIIVLSKLVLKINAQNKYYKNINDGLKIKFDTKIIYENFE